MLSAEAGVSWMGRGAAVLAVVLAASVAGACAEPRTEAGTPPSPSVGTPWKDVPFQATQVIVRRGPGGEVETRGLVARNSAGSMYVELVDARTQQPTEALIFDVPHRRELVLDLLRRRYRVMALPGLEGREAPADFVAEQLRVAELEKDSSVHRVSDGVDSTWKGLGVRNVAGLATVGSVRVERPVAAPGETKDGPAEVDERWVSVDLGIAVLRVKHDPLRDEDTEIALTAVMRSEPDSNLFQVPAGFVMVDAERRSATPRR